MAKPLTTTAGGGYGLTGMDERARLLGDRLGLRPDPGRVPRRVAGSSMTEAPITVLIADDQQVVREGLTMVLGLMPGVEIVGSASDGGEALDLVDRLAPDVVRMDLRMPNCDGVQATRLITQRNPGTKVVVLTTYADDHSVIQALRAGASGFLTKDAGRRPTRTNSQTASLPGRRVCWRSSLRASQTPRSPTDSPSPKPPTRVTSTTCTARPALATELKPSPTPIATASPPAHLTRERAAPTARA